MGNLDAQDLDYLREAHRCALLADEAKSESDEILGDMATPTEILGT